MTDGIQQSMPGRAQPTAADVEGDVLHQIGRGLIDHKESLYWCHRTGLTAELAWPIMESILGYIRPYLKDSNLSQSELRLLPLEPTPDMVSAALEASIQLRNLWEADDVQPDSPGQRPAAMVSAVWHAMLGALPTSAAGFSRGAAADDRENARPLRKSPVTLASNEERAYADPIAKSTQFSGTRVVGLFSDWFRPLSMALRRGEHSVAKQGTSG